MTYELLGTMGPKPHIYKASNGHTVCQLHQPIAFPCVVDEKTLTASLTHAEDDGTQWLYHVQFSDGHKAVFKVNKEQGVWKEKGQHTPSPYAKAINQDLLLIYQFDPFHPPFCLSVAVNGETITVWAKREQSGCWGVYCGGAFRFFVHYFTGRWQPETIDHPTSYLVPEITEAVIQKLESLVKLTLVTPPESTSDILN